MAEDDKKSLLSITSSAESPLTAVRLVANETISELFRFEVEVVASGRINTTNMLNKPACVAVNHGGQTTRYFHGIVSEFGLLEQSGAQRIASAHTYSAHVPSPSPAAHATSRPSR